MAEVEDHLAACDECLRWQERAHQLRRATLSSAADGGSAVFVSDVPRRFTTYRWVRFGLAWAGALLVAWNLVDMFAKGSGQAFPFERHQAAFGVALGLAFLFVALRLGLAAWSRLRPPSPLALSVSAIIDLINGASTLLRESAHLVEIAGLALLWVLGAAAGPGRRPRQSCADELAPGWISGSRRG